MNLGIVGCRHFKDYNVFCEMMECLTKKHLDGQEISRIISGGAAGVDQMAKMWAEENGIPCVVFSVADEPQDLSFTEQAHRRNQKIVDESNLVFAFPSRGSRGTWDTVRRAERRHPASVVICRLETWKPE